MYLLTAVCLFFLNLEFKAYIDLRQRYLQQRKPHMRTIMLDVPRDARSNAILESYFGYLYPGSVLSAVCTQVRHGSGACIALGIRNVPGVCMVHMKEKRPTGSLFQRCVPGLLLSILVPFCRIFFV